MCHCEYSRQVQKALFPVELHSPGPSCCADVHSRHMSAGCRLVEGIPATHRRAADRPGHSRCLGRVKTTGCVADDVGGSADGFPGQSLDRHPAKICGIRLEPRWAATDSNRESCGKR